jgi:signal transduction histidine kinase
MFTRTRIRLTAWYVAILATFLILIGAAVYAVVRQQAENGITSGLRLTAGRAAADMASGNLADLDRLNRAPYTVTTVLLPSGIGQVRRASPQFSLPYGPALNHALKTGRDVRTVGSGESGLRLYTMRVNDEEGRPAALVQVARSTEPEHQTLGNLLTGLLLGGVGGLLLAAIGGWFLAGKSLRPLRDAFDRQHAFVADASHELRTPLAVIRANAEYLNQQQPDNPEVQDIVSETERLSALVDTLLAVARGDSAERGAIREPLDLGDVVSSSATAMQPLAAGRGIDLTVAAGEGLRVQGDREQLRQLVIILVDNALRYTAAGGRVHVYAGNENGNALVTVHDTGIGMPEEAQARVFERFYRADDARNRESGGAGLGLAIAEELVHGHGGRISVESTPGAGSTFTVRLPLFT